MSFNFIDILNLLLYSQQVRLVKLSFFRNYICIILISCLYFICFLFSRWISLTPIFVTLGKQKAFSLTSDRRSILAYFHCIMKTTLGSEPIAGELHSQEPIVELWDWFQRAVSDTWMQVAILKPGGCSLSLEWASPQFYIGQWVTHFNAGLSLPCQSSHWNIFLPLKPIKHSCDQGELAYWGTRVGTLRRKSLGTVLFGPFIICLPLWGSILIILFIHLFVPGVAV